MAELIVALDFSDPKDLLACARNLSGTLSWCKVGLEAFVKSGPALVNELDAMGLSVFLDLKFYDIPNTVAAAVRSACKTRAKLLTVHTQGGEAMCRAARAAADEAGEERPLIFGVTVLTSFGEGTMPGITRAPQDFAMELAGLAETAGFQVAGVLTQQRDRPDTRTCLGEGKLRELSQFVKANGAELILFGNELTPSQIKNIENEQKRLAKQIPFKIKFTGNYLWQIYYSEIKLSE